MAGQSKLKTLYVMKILNDMTDESNILTAVDICSILEETYGIRAERKSIYADIDTLMLFGMDIVQLKGTNPGYYLASKQFDLPELKLLVDAVSASKFITKSKSEKLIKKLETLGSVSEAKKLRRSVTILNRPKTDNETVFRNVDYLHEAIYEDCQIRFKYAQWTPDKKLELRHGGADYYASPWALTWDDENYYMVAYDEANGDIRHYRVDKMRSIEMLDEKRLGKKAFTNFDLGSYSKKTFGMFAGEDTKVVLRCKDSLCGVMIDRFGKDIPIVRCGDGFFEMSVSVAVSSQFFGWLCGIGKDVTIVSPQRVKDEFTEYVKNILAEYK